MSTRKSSAPRTSSLPSLTTTTSTLTTPPSLPPSPKDEYPNVIRAENLLASIPNDDDLRRAYQQENQIYLRKKKERVQVGREGGREGGRVE
jgi:hypothetical protein